MILSVPVQSDATPLLLRDKDSLEQGAQREDAREHPNLPPRFEDQRLQKRAANNETEGVQRPFGDE